MTPDQLILGADMHHFERAVLDDEKGAALVATLEEVRRSSHYEIGAATRKTVSRGYEPAHERAGFLLHEGLTAHLDIPTPAEIHSPDFVDYCAGHYRAIWPVSRWLLQVLRGGV